MIPVKLRFLDKSVYCGIQAALCLQHHMIGNLNVQMQLYFISECLLVGWVDDFSLGYSEFLNLHLPRCLICL